MTRPRSDTRPLPDAAILLDVIEELVQRYVVFRSAHQRAAVTLWIAHTHVLEAFDVTPYLNIRSAEKRSGKTRLAEVIAELVPRPWATLQPSEAVLYRKIDKQCPTLLLDEVDAIFKGPPNHRTEGLRALLNGGYRRGVTVDRCTGKNREQLAAFRVFSSLLTAAWGLTGGCWPVGGGMVLPTEAPASANAASRPEGPTATTIENGPVLAQTVR